MIQNLAKRNPGGSSARHFGGIILRGFFAYLALTPVIFCWGLLLIVLFIITLASFEAQTSYAVEAVIGVIAEQTARFPFLDRFALDSEAISDAGVIEINNRNLGDVIFGIYTWVAMPFVVFGLLWELVRGPRPHRPLSRKIKILNRATLAVIAALFLNFLLGSEIWLGSALSWALMFTVGPGIVWIISATSLAINHLIANLDIETRTVHT